MIFKNITELFKDQKSYPVEFNDGMGQVWVFNPRRENPNDMLVFDEDDYLVDVIIVRGNGMMTSVAGKHVKNNEIVVTQFKKHITLPSWKKLNLIKNLEIVRNS
jgi:hypothetical protein